MSLAFQNGYAKCRPIGEQLGIIDPLDGEDAASEKLYQYLVDKLPDDKKPGANVPENTLYQTKAEAEAAAAAAPPKTPTPPPKKAA